MKPSGHDLLKRKHWKNWKKLWRKSMIKLLLLWQQASEKHILPGFLLKTLKEFYLLLIGKKFYSKQRTLLIESCSKEPVAFLMEKERKRTQIQYLHLFFR